MAAKFHSLRRTSPKGGPFIGTCILCGKAGLTSSAVFMECENIRGLSQEQALLEILEDVPELSALSPAKLEAM